MLPSPKVGEYSCMKPPRGIGRLSAYLNKSMKHIMNLFVAIGNYSLIELMDHCYIRTFLESRPVD
jgi:hypothetical protein